GSRIAADFAAKEWERKLDADRVQLSAMLRRVNGTTPGMALEKGRGIFDEWLKRVDGEWRAKARAGAQQVEWKHYLEQAHSAGLGKKGGAKAESHPGGAGYEDEYVAPARKGPVPWEVMMEPPGTGEPGQAGTPQDEIKVLARAPAKLLDGLFTVRLNLT